MRNSEKVSEFSSTRGRWIRKGGEKCEEFARRVGCWKSIAHYCVASENVGKREKRRTKIEKGETEASEDHLKDPKNCMI